MKCVCKYIYIYIPRTSACVKLSLEVGIKEIIAVSRKYRRFTKLSPFRMLLEASIDSSDMDETTKWIKCCFHLSSMKRR